MLAVGEIHSLQGNLLSDLPSRPFKAPVLFYLTACGCAVFGSLGGVLECEQAGRLSRTRGGWKVFENTPVEGVHHAWCHNHPTGERSRKSGALTVLLVRLAPSVTRCVCDAASEVRPPRQAEGNEAALADVARQQPVSPSLPPSLPSSLRLA